MRDVSGPFENFGADIKPGSSGLLHVFEDRFDLRYLVRLRADVESRYPADLLNERAVTRESGVGNMLARSISGRLAAEGDEVGGEQTSAEFREDALAIMDME